MLISHKEYLNKVIPVQAGIYKVLILLDPSPRGDDKSGFNQRFHKESLNKVILAKERIYKVLILLDPRLRGITKVTLIRGSIRVNDKQIRKLIYSLDQLYSILVVLEGAEGNNLCSFVTVN
ncbi:MAG: hypothetical protein QS748_08070 [Candidatus Endonucleobacter bathymodioli]|uniref:Uncharacterized protein n=1 Tax=Candidatus Endonucleibacter bathymodioli TaxID=539814 RepID=A0AA90SY08_9GAMM|nr:hypothetical protein [Candidatus Endonucleobacter bathymodioli]